MKVNRFAPWFGANTKNAAAVSRLLSGCNWVAIPFAGSMAELPFIKARTIVVNDFHEMIINLARVVANEDEYPKLLQLLDGKLFHPTVLQDARRVLSNCSQHTLLEIAEAYFVSLWMGRGGKGGTPGELKGALPIRWNANGGDSCKRYRSIVESLDGWHEQLKRCNFECLDFTDLMQKIQDKPKHGIYCDPPWPDAGRRYKHRFSEYQQRELAAAVSNFKTATVVMRFGDHPLIRELYPETKWAWESCGGRDQANKVTDEVMIFKNAV